MLGAVDVRLFHFDQHPELDPRRGRGTWVALAGAGASGRRLNSCGETIVARPLTCRPILSRKKSRNSSPTCRFSCMLPRLAMTPLPRYSGYARVRSPSTVMNPAGPARKDASHSPWASDVLMKTSSMRLTNACMLHSGGRASDWRRTPRPGRWCRACLKGAFTLKFGCTQVAIRFRFGSARHLRWHPLPTIIGSYGGMRRSPPPIGGAQSLVLAG